MAEKYLMFNLDDEKAKSLGEVIANPTARKIVNLLAEKELSESEISKELNLALNTVEYNLNKLLDSGVIEKSKFFYSVKGKKIETYKVANKLIVISPRKSNVYNKLKGIIPVVFISAIFTAFIWLYNKTNLSAEKADNFVSAPQIEIVSKSAGVGSFVSSMNILDWFLIIIWILIIGFVVLSLRKKA